MASLLPATMHHLTQHVLTFTTDIPGLHLRPEFAVLVHDPGDGSNLVVRCYGPTLRPSATPIVKASANPTSNTSRPTEYFPSGSRRDCVPKGPQSAPTVYKPANAQCPAGWFSSGAYACEKF